LLDWSAVQTRSILTPQLAFLMTDVLSDDQSRWPSLGHPNPLEIGRPAAAILGRSADAESNWAVGYTPQFVISAWIGLGSHQTDQPIDAEIGRQLPGATAGLWHAVAQVAHQGLPILTWSAPPGVSFLEVCDPSGLLPTPACPNTVQEVFQTENEPVHSDDLFQEVMVNRQTGRLATVFTPLDLVDAKVFMVPPPEFKSWVSRAGTPLSPEVYDVIPSTYPTWPDAAITAPSMFSEIHGKVMISGTAGSSTGGGRGGSSYRLQVGQGLNPQSWLQVGEDSSQGVLNGQLGVWDTSGLDGLYAIQLLVIHTDQSVHRNTVLVTVDNKPPLISLDYPLNGMQISAAERSSLIFQVSAQDDLSLQQVELFLDGRHLGTFTQPPFALSWNLTPGQHTLVVRASDQAGNISETSIDFTVVA
jgi:membrane carboxypeptidase/penicillin-binding protein PbpC